MNTVALNTSEATSEVTAQEREQSLETNQVIIEAANPSSEEMVGIKEHIKVNHNFDVDVKAVEFKFKKSIDKESKIETIRKAVELAIPYPSVAGIVAILETGGKQLDLLLEAMQGVVNSTARDILYEVLPVGDAPLNASTFPTDRLSWEAIANIPKAQRKGSAISKDTWDAFAQDYCEVMPEVTGKNMEQIGRAVKILVRKFVDVKSRDDVLQFMVEQLALYAGSTPNLDEFAVVVEFLSDKANTLLNADPTDLLAAL